MITAEALVKILVKRLPEISAFVLKDESEKLRLADYKIETELLETKPTGFVGLFCPDQMMDKHRAKYMVDYVLAFCVRLGMTASADASPELNWNGQVVDNSWQNKALVTFTKP